MAAKDWVGHAKEQLLRSLEPVAQELNELDWKLDLTENEEGFHGAKSSFWISQRT